MGQVVYDNLSYYVNYYNEIFEEGYKGYMVEENYNSTYFVIYKMIDERGETERRFVLPDNTLHSFFQLKSEIGNHFKQQDLLLKMMWEVATIYNEVGGDLRDICNKYYEDPENYLKFVVMNVMKSQFYFFVSERYEKTLH